VLFSGVFSGFNPPKPVYQILNLSFLVVFLGWAGIISSYPCQNTSTKQGLNGKVIVSMHHECLLIKVKTMGVEVLW
jgi:hypothetical protein